MSLLEIAQIATGLSLLVATATFVAAQIDRAKKARQERILRWQRVIVYSLVTSGIGDFDHIRDAYLARSQQFSDVKIPKSQLQDSTLTLILMQLTSDSLIVFTEDEIYVPNLARTTFSDENLKQMLMKDMNRRLVYNKLLSSIYDLLDIESGTYNIDQMYRRLSASIEDFTFDDFHIYVREMIARGIVVTAPDGKVWLRSKLLPAQKS